MFKKLFVWVLPVLLMLLGSSVATAAVAYASSSLEKIPAPSVAARVSSRTTSSGRWLVGGDWGYGILRTLARGAGDSAHDATYPDIFAHEQHPSVWGVHFGYDFRLAQHWSLGWRLGVRSLGRTNGTFVDFANQTSYPAEKAIGWDGLLHLGYHLNRHFSVFGGLGAIIMQVRREVSATGRNIDLPGLETRFQANPEWRIGFAYQVKQLLLSLSYYRVVGSNTSTLARSTGDGRGTMRDPTASGLVIGLSLMGHAASPSRYSAIDNSWFLGVNWGFGILRTLERGVVDNGNPGDFHNNNQAAVWGAHVGRDYALSDVWGLSVELGYRYLGKATGSYLLSGLLSERQEKARGWDGLLNIKYHISQHLSVFGGLGAMVFRLRREVVGDNGDAYPGSEGRTQIDPEFALGIDYQIKQLVLSLSYHRVVGSSVSVPNRMGFIGRDTHLDPTASSVLIGADFKWAAPRMSRLPSDYNANAWVIGGDWGLGVLRTLERGAGDNDTSSGVDIFDHKNHPSVWGMHVGRDYGLGGRWGLGWRVGYRNLGRTSGSFINDASRVSYRSEKASGWDGLLQLDYHLDRHLSVFGGLGAMAMRLRREVVNDNGVAYPGSEGRTQIDPEFMVGMSYQVKQLLLSLSYRRVVGADAGVNDAMAGGKDESNNAHLDPTASSILIGADFKWAASAMSRLPSDYNANAWVIGGDWGLGVLRTLERGASDNAVGPDIFDHKNHPSVWGAHVGRNYGLGGHWSLGWRVGYRYLGKTSGSFINDASRVSYRSEKVSGWDGLLQLDYRLDPHLSVFGGLGGMAMRLRREVVNDNGVAYPGSEGRTQMDPEVMLGVRYQIKSLQLSLSYDRVIGSEVTIRDQMSGPGNTAHLDPTASSLLVGASFNWAMSASERLPSDYNTSAWVVGGDWGQGVVRTLEWSASDNSAAGPDIFDHKNHPNVWGAHIGQDFGLGGHWGLGWRLGYRYLGKTNGSFINDAAQTSYRDNEIVTGFDGLFLLDYHVDRHLTVFGGLGPMVMRLRREIVNNNGIAYPGSEGRTQIDPELMLGASYQVKRLRLSLSYDRVVGAETSALNQMLDTTHTTHLDPTVSSILLGVSVVF